MPITDLMKQAATYLNADDTLLLERAYKFAAEAHKGQLRKSGEPYIIHPIAVASILADLHLDIFILVAGLLHDVVEDTEITLEEIAQEFGETVANLVNGITKLVRRVKFTSREERQAENYRKMFVAMAKDIRVVIIKLADRLHNMRTLCYVSEHKRLEKATETLEIFAPLAHRLGMSKIKWELEDLSFRYINPQQYYRIVQLMHQKRKDREQYLEKIIEVIRQNLADMNADVLDINGRPKHIYSIYCKMRHKNFEEIYDLHAVRIILPTVKDCYAVLGIIHTIWKPVLGRFKDYIAMPKTNMYQSIHTTVFGDQFDPIEIQIRTTDMHKTAEFGIAAHWSYKEGEYTGDNSSSHRNLPWMKQLMELQQETSDATEFVESLKIDWFSDSVFIFTPQGDVVELPVGSVVIDFAFRIHTEIGYRCIGAKINGRIAALDVEIKTGDIIEILTSKHSYGPSLDWLRMVKTSTARNRIRAYFKRQRKEDTVAKGREVLEKLLRKKGLDPSTLLKDTILTEIAKQFNLGDAEDLLAAVGYGGVSSIQIAMRLTKDHKSTDKSAEKTEDQSSSIRLLTQVLRRDDVGVRVAGVDNLLIRLSKCCTPVPGDEIIGFITKGRGVTVHRIDCTNMIGIDEERKITVEWVLDKPGTYSVEIEICGLGILNDVLQMISADPNTHLSAINAREKAGMASITLTIGINNTKHLKQIIDRIKSIQDVFAVRRIMH